MATKMTKTKRIPCIITVGEPGRAVVFGWADAMPEPEQAVTLYRARMILYWADGGGLFGLASNGPAPGSRLTCEVSETRATARQVLSVNKAAAKALTEWPSV